MCVCMWGGTQDSPLCSVWSQPPAPTATLSHQHPLWALPPPPEKKTLQNQQLLFGEMKSTMLNSPWGPFITHTHAPEASNLQKSANPPPPTKVPPKVPRSPERSHRAMAPPAGEPPLTALPLFHLIGQPN